MYSPVNVQIAFRDTRPPGLRIMQTYDMQPININTRNGLYYELQYLAYCQRAGVISDADFEAAIGVLRHFIAQFPSWLL